MSIPQVSSRRRCRISTHRAADCTRRESSARPASKSPWRRCCAASSGSTRGGRPPREAISGNTRNIQRAHGVLDGRQDRYDRTLRLLEGPEQLFETWWPFFREHDATVMITRTEHSTGVRFRESEMIRLPVEDPDMFVTSGFSLRMRKGKEISWLRNLVPQDSVSNT